MPGVLNWGYYPAENKWVPLRVDADGSIHVVGYVDKLDDIGDVNVPAPGDGNFLYWDDAAGKWKDRAGKLVHAITQTAVYQFLATSSTPRTAIISSIAGDVITLTANDAGKFWTHSMNGHSYLKISNTTKDPSEYAWVKASPAANQLQVTVAGDIAGWALNDVISTAYDGASSVYGELDLSPTIPAGATGILAGLTVMDSGVIAGVTGNQITTDPAGHEKYCQAQVQGLLNYSYPFSDVTAKRHILFRDRATGVNTLTTMIHITGYVS